MSRVTVLIPAYNEADRIGETVRAARGLPGVGGVIVIDDGSTDGTAEAAELAGAEQVIRMPQNGGKGAALSAGIAAAKTDMVVFLDADLGATASAAGPLIEPILVGSADMTIAVLPSVKRSGGFGFAVGLARWGIRKFTGMTMKAPISGQRAIKKEIIERMGGFDRGFGVETGLTIDAVRMGYRVEEVPVNISHRATGKDFRGFMHRGRQFVDIARALIARTVATSRAKRIANPQK